MESDLINTKELEKLSYLDHTEINYQKISKFDLNKKKEDMGTVELRSDLHKILDRIENEQLLRTIYDFLIQRENTLEGQIWNDLTEEQKNEVYLSYEESKDDKNLIDWETLKKKY